MHNRVSFEEAPALRNDRSLRLRSKRSEISVKCSRKRKALSEVPMKGVCDVKNSEENQLESLSSRVSGIWDLQIRPSTLPSTPWATSSKLWKGMLLKEQIYTQTMYITTNAFAQHPELQPRMRSILLDWLIEVCEVYLLHRETFYLAQDFIDRFLSTRKNIPKTQLQLVGIASLFIAAKVEEIYPPKLSEFAYVTDGACTEKEILQMELLILMSLKWLMSPMTVNSWLNVFLQAACCQESRVHDLETRGFSGHSFGHICQLLDLCILDINCLKFPYSVLAASAIAHLVSKDLALSASGFQWKDIHQCFQWMKPFFEVLSLHQETTTKFFKNVASWDRHNIQTHCVGLKLLERVKFTDACSSNSSPKSGNLGIMTPPQSAKKLCVKETSPLS